jgi:hypothetical protein
LLTILIINENNFEYTILVDILRTLSEDKSVKVREAVAGNTSAPVDIIE